MARRFFIVSYDVTDDRRRNRVAKTMNNFGDRVQYSVFSCQLNPRELVQLGRELRGILDHNDDQVLIVDTGPVLGPHPQPKIDYIGKPFVVLARSQIV